MKAWKYDIWELPYFILRDFVYIEDCGLLIYTIEGHEQVYVKNVADGNVLAVMSGHNCTPSIYFTQESYVLMTGDVGTVRVWRIYEDLVNKYDEYPPW